MKTSFKSNHAVPISIAAFGIALCLLLTNPTHAAINPEDPIVKSERIPGKKIPNKVNYTLNNESVKIYPDILKRTMHVIAKENDTK